MVAGLCERVRAAFLQPGRGVQAGYLEETVEAMLVEGRCWQKREVMGGPHVRAMLRLAGGAEGVPAWLAEQGEKGLPALRRFEVRLVGEARPRRDGAETGGFEVRLVALALRAGAAAP